MTSLSIDTNTYSINMSANALSESFQARAAKFKELTGREVIKEKDENGNFIHMLHPESSQRLGFMVDFFRVGFNSPDGFEAALENLARKYIELREELLEQYGENEDEFYRRIGGLNHAFENALQSMLLLPIQTPPSNNIASSNAPQNVHGGTEQKWREYESIKGFMQNVQMNMAKHLDTFFETFIKNIQNADFDTAFASSFDRLNTGESKSLSNMSFRDTVLVRDILHQGRFEEEERDGSTFNIFSFNRPIDSLRQAASNTNISILIRRELTDVFGFNIRFLE